MSDPAPADPKPVPLPPVPITPAERAEIEKKLEELGKSRPTREDVRKIVEEVLAERAPKDAPPTPKPDEDDDW